MERNVSRPTRAGKAAASRSSYFPDFAAIAEQAAYDGLYVLPACLDPKEKHPAVMWKEFQIRKPTAAEIAGWIPYFYNCNGMYVTGPMLGRFVLDCDDAAAVRWARSQGLPPTQTLRTSRGLHFHFRYPDFIVHTVAGKIHHHVDVRGAGGVALAAGSIHDTGFIYRWARGCSSQEIKLAKAPKWLLQWLREYAQRHEQRHQAARVDGAIQIEGKPFSGVVSPWAAAAIAGELARLRAAEDGTRNDTLTRVSFKLGQLAGGGEADADELLAQLHEVAAVLIADEPEKSADTIRRCFAQGMRNPRSAP